MKKTLLTIAAMAAVMSAGATDYTGALQTNAGGQKGAFDNATVSVDDNGDGTSTVTIHNFAYKYYAQDMNVGNIVLTSVPTVKVGSVTMLDFEGRVDIAAGDNGDLTWLGPSYSALCQGGVPVVFKAEVRGDKLAAALDLDTYQAARHRIKATFGDSRYVMGQMLGSDFEAWHKATFTNPYTQATAESDEPDGWHSFMSCTGTYANVVSGTVHTFISDEVRPGSTGKSSIKVVSGLALGIVPANGTITNGRMIAGSFSASDPANNATSDPSSTDVDASGDPFYTPLTTRPDSIAVWVKFKPGTLDDDHKDDKYATISAIINDGTKYQDPEDVAYTNVVAKAQYCKIAENDFQWQRIVVPFDYASYVENGASPKAILVTLSTNSVPGVGSTDADNPDQLFVDDLELIYNAKLESAEIAGQAVEGFSKDNFYYDNAFTSDHELTADDVKGVVDGYDSHPSVAISRSENEPGKVTVTVTLTSGDLRTVNAYTFVGKEPVADVVTNYTDKMTISLNGVEFDPQEATISIADHSDGTYDFSLNQFSFAGMLVGDVTMKNVAGTTDANGYTTFECDADADITNGDKIAADLGGKVHVKMNAQTNPDGMLYAEISLPVSLEGDTMDVYAVFGNKTYTSIKSVVSDNGGIKAIYDLNGHQLLNLQRGVNIVRMANGKTVKIVKK